MHDLDGRTAVVTGAASGIGLALARRCAAAGMNLVVADVDPVELDAVASGLADGGTAVLAVPTDVADAEAVDALADAAWDRFGAVHLLCNNAGVGPGGVSWEIPLAQWRWVIDVNLWGVVHGIRSFVPRMLAQQEGHVLNTASNAGLVGSPGMAAYSSTKHAVVGLSRCLADDLRLADAAIGVTVLCPGMTRTRMNDSGRSWPVDRLGAPPATGLEPGHPSTRAGFYERMEREGADPAAVADSALEAVRADRFWALTDPRVLDRVREDVDAMTGTVPVGDTR